MKALTIIATLSVIMVLSGCASNNIFMTVDFKQGETLRYKFVSSREIDTIWGVIDKGPKSGTEKIDESRESVESVVSYTPVESDSMGPTIIKAYCDSVQYKRDPDLHRIKDAVGTFAGKSFTFGVLADGTVSDYSELTELIKQAGDAAFRKNAKQGRIKEPDLIMDFVASQWFLFDSISSIKNPTKGVDVNDVWESKLSVPLPMVMREARKVTYRLADIQETPMGRIAVIKSVYSLSDSTPVEWPIPYTGTFRMSGRFGFLRNYKILELTGEGEELFNIDLGRIEKSEQRYKVVVEAGIPFSMDISPRIVIDQVLTTQLLETSFNQ